jgi:plasmid maintenance system killer protein
MIQKRLSPLLLPIVLLCLCFQSTQIQAQPVSGRILAGVNITEAEEKVEVSINFNFPVRYISNFPEKSGDELRIELQPIAVSPDDSEALSNRESITPAAGNPAGITEIIYEGDTFSNLFLTIYFRSKSKFAVKQGTDYRSLRVTVEPQVVSGNYAINLESSIKTIDLSAAPQPDIFQKYTLYQTKSEIDSQVWNRLRLGFFPTVAAANKVLNELQSLYPRAWVTKAPQSDIRLAAQSPISLAAAKQVAKVEEKPAAVEPEPVPATPKKQLTAERIKQLLDEGEKAMIAGNFSRAAIIYSRLVESDDPATSQQALEFLGLARERGNQMAHAKAEYEKYLTLYPVGEGADRVRQRLAGVLTAQAEPKPRLRRTKAAEGETEWQTDVYGSFSQFYDRDVTFTNNEDAVVNRSSLSTDLDLHTRFRNDNYDIRTSFVGGLENDFLDDDDNEERISSLYVDILSYQLEASTRIGRQSRSTGGVLGRFDGALISWQAFEKIGINLVGGYPVMSSRDIDIDTSRPFYGISFDLGTFADRWDFNTYIITQDVDGIVDRRAIGGEVRYFHPTHSFFSLVDYDIDYSELNTVLFTGNWTLWEKTTFNLSFDYRKSPILTTSNALIGQTAQSIDELLLSFTEDEVRQFAQDRTATSKSMTIGITHQLHQKLQISADLTVSKFSSTPASGGVAALEGTDYEYFYSLQFIGSSLIKDGDIAIIGLRYSDTDRSNLYSVNLNTRYPITPNLRINPRAVLDYRTNKDDDGEQWKFRPLVRLEYRWKRRYQFEIEAGGEWSSEKSDVTVDDRRGYFFTVGYRINF